MAQKVQLKAKSRAEIGKGAAKRMRDQGAVPGTVYGAHMKPINITVGVEELEQALLEMSIPVEEIVGSGGGETKRSRYLCR